MRDHLPRRLKAPISNRRLLLLGIAIAIAVYRFYFQPQSSQPEIQMIEVQPRPSGDVVNEATEPCTQWQGCFTGTIAHIVDGDTLDVRSGTTRTRVRLVLVDAPERGADGGAPATQQLEQLCPASSPAAVYPDLNQPRDEYGRTLGVIYCSGRNANAEMIRSGHARLYGRFCRKSVFGRQEWARQLGCRA